MWVILPPTQIQFNVAEQTPAVSDVYASTAPTLSAVQYEGQWSEASRCLDLCRPVSELKGGGGGVDGTAGWGTAFTPIWLQAFRHVSGLQTDVKGGVELSNPATVIIRSKQRQSERLCSCDGLTEGLDTVERWSQRRVADALLELCVAAACNQREQHFSLTPSYTVLHCNTVYIILLSV